jgi:hypothetical protein
MDRRSVRGHRGHCWRVLRLLLGSVGAGDLPGDGDVLGRDAGGRPYQLAVNTAANWNALAAIAAAIAAAAQTIAFGLSMFLRRR